MQKNVLQQAQDTTQEEEQQSPASSGAKEKGVAAKGKMTRRTMLQFLGLQAVTGVLAANAIAAPKNFNPKHTNRQITPDQLPNTRAWITTNPAQCVGCRTCEIVCSLAHDGQCQPSLSRINTTFDPTKSLTKMAVLPNICHQCNMADCYLACANDALLLDKKTGARFIDPAKCVGCGECFAACPWDMIVPNEEAGTFSKCDLCGGDPQCVKYCPASALTYIELS